MMGLRLGIGIMVPASARPTPTSAPVNTSAPTITGIRTQGQTLTASPGSWTGLPSGAFAYQWKRNGTNISGATGSTYVAQAADVSAGASALTVTISATNVIGTTSANSAGVTIAAPLTISGTPGPATVGGSYLFTPTSTGGHSPKTYALTGTLPSGLSFNTSTGAITGTPVSSGTASGLNITVTDVDGLTASLGTFSLVVASSGLSWLTSAEVVNDITVNSTQGSVSSLPPPGTVSLPTNGWVLRLTTTLGAISSCDPTKVTLTVTDFGWDTDGSAVSSTRTIKGTARVPKPSPDGTTFTDADRAAGVVEFALEQQLYNSSVTDDTGRTYRSVINEIAFASGFMTGASGSSTVGAYTGGVTRSDSKDYPLPIIRNIDRWDMVMGPSGYLDFEWSCGHEWAQKGQQVACFEAWARVSGTDGPVARASSMTDSRWTSDGLVPRGLGSNAAAMGGTNGMHAPVYSTRIYGTGLADGVQGTIRGCAKPWIGPKVNTFDTGIGETRYHFNLMADIPFVKDVSTGKYSPIYAYVNQDGTGLTGASTAGISTSATDPGGANSYTTINQAILAAKAYNNSTSLRGTGKIHNDADGLIIMLRDVAGSTVGQDANAYSMYEPVANQLVTANRISVTMPVIIRAASGVRSAAVRFRPNKFDGSAITTANKLGPTKIQFENIYFDGPGTTAIFMNAPSLGSQPITDGTHNSYVVCLDCDVVGDGTNYPFNSVTSTFGIRTKWDNTLLQVGWGGYAGQYMNIGCSFFGAAVPDQLHALANYSADKVPMGPSVVNSQGVPRSFIMVNNWWDVGTGNSGNGTSMGTFANRANWHGLFVLGVLHRHWGSVNKQVMYLSADNDMKAIKNVVGQYYSTPASWSLGDTNGNHRWNLLYNDNGWVRIDKEGSFKFCAFAQTATKASYFNQGGLSSLGAAAYNAGTTYYLGDTVWDSATGSNTLTTSNLYQALRDTPAGTPLSNTTYWLNVGIYGNNGTIAQARRTGNHRYMMGVNSYGNVNGGSVQFNPDQTPNSTGSWLSFVRFPGSGTKWGAADPATYYVSDSQTQAAGVGNYRPSPTGPLVNMVPANMSTAPFDLFGTPRKNDGTGAASALERVA